MKGIKGWKYFANWRKIFSLKEKKFPWKVVKCHGHFGHFANGSICQISGTKF